MPFELRSLDLEGCVLAEGDVAFLGRSRHAAALERLNVGLWNFKQLAGDFVRIVPKLVKVPKLHELVY